MRTTGRHRFRGNAVLELVAVMPIILLFAWLALDQFFVWMPLQPESVHLRAALWQARNGGDAPPLPAGWSVERFSSTADVGFDELPLEHRRVYAKWSNLEGQSLGKTMEMFTIVDPRLGPRTTPDIWGVLFSGEGF